MFGAANKHIRRDPDRLQFFDAVLCRFGFQLTRGGKIRQQREVHKDALSAWFIMGELADGLKKGQAFDIADGAADLAKHEINLIFANA